MAPTVGRSSVPPKRDYKKSVIQEKYYTLHADYKHDNVLVVRAMKAIGNLKVYHCKRCAEIEMLDVGSV